MPKQMAAVLFSEEKTQKDVSRGQRKSMIKSAAFSFAFNLLYALYHFAVGIMNMSLWLVAMGAVYWILATMRFSAVLCGRRNDNLASEDIEYFVMKLTGAFFILLSCVLAAVIYISLSQNIAARHGEIIMITIAAYTFFKITRVIIRSVKQRKNSSPLLSVIRSISAAEAAVSVLTLQRSMLVSFGSMESEEILIMNILTGTAVWIFVLTLGFALIIKGIKKGSKVSCPEVRTKYHFK